MKVLLTGILPHCVWTIAGRIARGGHKVTVIGARNAPPHIPGGVRDVRLDQGRKETARYIAAAGFDSVLFFFGGQCEDRREYGSLQGSQLDVLFEVLYGAGRADIGQFVLITDQRVFGEGQSGAETELPIPDASTGVMLKAAESCVSCISDEKLKRLIVRTSSLYEENDPASFFSELRRTADSGRELILSGSAETPCDFLHAEDFGTFLEYAVSTELAGVVHVFQGSPCTYGELLSLVSSRIPGLSAVYTDTRRCLSPLSGTTAASMGWVPRHDFRKELDTLLETEGSRAKSGQGNALLRIFRKNSPAQAILRWTEVLLLGPLAEWLRSLGETNALLSVIDYRLLYVFLIGAVHGRFAGIAASAFACFFYVSEFLKKGGAASDLLFNTDHWLPLSIYFLCGAVSGYLSDRQRTEMLMLTRERDELLHERDFMEGIYERTSEDRNLLKEQIYHYRDSYGRIYQITRELDSLQPVQVFLSTLHVLESTLQCRSVAIFSCQPDSSYIRLVVRSRDMQGLPRSLNLKDFKDMDQSLREGRLFVNRTLLPDCPAYALPVMSGDEMLAVLMLWHVPFEQQSMYLENLMTVVAGLVQSALVRALKYHRQAADLYFEDTHILMPEAFRHTLGLYQTIRQRHTGEHMLVRLDGAASLSMELVDRYIGKLVRSTDLVGRLDNGEYYILFPQAATAQLPQINARFNTYGLHCEVIPEDLNVA